MLIIDEKYWKLSLSKIFCWYVWMKIVVYSQTWIVVQYHNKVCLMKYWHCNLACFKAKIRECSDITKLLRGWSRGVWTHWHDSVSCIMIGKIFFDTSGKKYTLKRGVSKWSPLPLFENPSPLPQSWEVTVGGSGSLGIWNLLRIKLLIFHNIV